jgi:hypothetical protein
MLRAPMPETTIDKHSNLLAGEGDVDGATLPTRYGVLHAVPEASSMQEPAQLQFWAGIAPRMFAHAFRDLDG